jgi:hypothetical protein
MTRRLWVLLMPALVFAATMFAAPAAVQAEPSTTETISAVAPCFVPPLSLSCNTGAVSAGSDGVVDFEINTGIAACQYYIRDITLNPTKVVRQGAGAGHFGGRVTGLTNWYRLELRKCAPGSSGAIW